jgi:hypothetical protein
MQLDIKFSIEEDLRKISRWEDERDWKSLIGMVGAKDTVELYNSIRNNLDIDDKTNARAFFILLGYRIRGDGAYSPVMVPEYDLILT